ncbi:hypothetical protein, partial [Streptococcus pneumoniae]|uniref:hypothetical protein n=1 Tax=Streptococcus pneumoniae TaxID=1313 RepID=UPI001953F7CF
TGAIGLATVALPGRPRAAAPGDAFATLDATAQAELVRRGEVKPVELLEAAIARIDALNPALNAIVTPLHD